jgi:hypothetical protein
MKIIKLTGLSLLFLTGCTQLQTDAGEPLVCDATLSYIPLEGTVENSETEKAVILNNCLYLKLCGYEEDFEAICLGLGYPI